MKFPYGSSELWAVLHPRIQWLATSPRNGVCGYAAEPIKAYGHYVVQHSEGESSWYTRLQCLDITDLPDNWEESLIQRPYVWKTPDENTPVDTRVWVRNAPGCGWWPRYLRCTQPGKVSCYIDGHTSRTGANHNWWSHCVLARPDDLAYPPPMDDPDLGKMPGAPPQEPPKAPKCSAPSQPPARLAASTFKRHTHGEPRRFRVRSKQGSFEVYGYDLEPIATCPSFQKAKMVQRALETIAEMEDGIAQLLRVVSEDHIKERS